MHIVYKKFMKNKKIVLVGSSGTLGSFFLKKFSEDKKIKLIIGADKTSKFKSKKNFKFYKLDIAKADNVNLFFSNIKKKYGIFDCLINTAGYTSEGSKEDRKNVNDFFDEKNWQKNIDINLNGVFYCIKYFIKHHNKNKNLQKIITIGSIYGSRSPDHSIYVNEKFFTPIGYSASKFGLNGINTWIASKFGTSKIISNIVSPGGVEHNLTKKFVNKYNKNVALGRMCSEEDVFNTVNYLLSDKSNYLNGQNIHVDGGYRI